MIAKPLRLAGWALTAVVVATVVATFFVVGSPLDARKQRADDRRANDLSEAVNMVREYYSNKKKLPDRLADCSSYSYRGADLNDPQTGRPYEYRPLTKDRFEVCAIFETDTTKKPSSTYYGYTFGFDRHPKGRACFTLPAKQ
ncbi:MAG: hypothetical protein ACHQ50_09450 [Fimbriimonadales bacterium]